MKNKYFDNTIEYISRKKIKGFEHKPIYFNSHTSKFYKVIKFSLVGFLPSIDDINSLFLKATRKTGTINVKIIK